MSRARLASIALAVAALAAVLPGAAAAAPALSCGHVQARTWRPATGVADPAGDIRVYAIQMKQEIRHVTTYGAFREKIECLIVKLVLPTADRDDDGRADGTTLVVFNEDAGLATIASGSRGAAARAAAAHGPKDPQNIPGAIGSFAAVGAAYAPAVAWYAQQEPETSPQRLILAAATDTFVRGFMRTFSDMARRYNVFVVSSNNQAEYRETSNPAAVAALADPDLAGEYATGRLQTVYEAVDVDEVPESTGAGRAGIDVHNKAWMWAPLPEGTVSAYARAAFRGLGRDGAEVISADDPRANIIHATKKTPLTAIERQVLDLSDDRDMRVSNTGPFCLQDGVPGEPGYCDGARERIGYGISLPSFMWGSDFGAAASGDPCATPVLWMRCLDARGVNLFLQPEANPGMWTEYIDTGWDPDAFQALSWMDSAWRAVADPTVANIRYTVTPHLVGNLVDLTFDGQSVIFERCLPRPSGGDTCDGNTPQAFAGAAELLPCAPGQTTRCDDPLLAPYAGEKRETMVLAPWVLGDGPLDVVENRERLAERARAMQAGSGSPYENDYLETAVWADLDLDPPA